jgi:hypothetical protein
VTPAWFTGRKLFGDGYSGLEYDYRGLLRLYQNKGNTQKAAEYSAILHEWNLLRDRNHVEYDVPLQFTVDSRHYELVVSQFFSIPERFDSSANV